MSNQKLFIYSLEGIRSIILENFSIIDKINREVKMCSVYLMIHNYTKKEQAARLAKARAHLDNAITIMKSLFEPDRNFHIKQLEKNDYKSIKIYNQNLGIANARIDIFLEKINELFTKISLPRDPESLAIEVYMRSTQTMIEEIRNAIVIYPFINAAIKLKNYRGMPDKEGNIIEKDYDLAAYFVFKESFEGTQVVGSAARQIIVSNKASGIKLEEPGKPLPDYPLSAKRTHHDEEEINKLVNEASIDPFEDEDV